MSSSEAKRKPADSLQGKEFLVVKNSTMVAASEVLRELEDYLVLSSVISPNPDRTILPADPVDLQLYAEYVERRGPYIRNDAESQLPGHIRRLYNQIVENLRGPEWALCPIDPCFSRSRDEILRELTTIGLSQAAWYYVVDNLPADTIQLRGALLVIMPDKMKTPEWKDQAVTRLSRIVELVSRLRFLMRLSQSGSLEREKLFDDLEIPKASIPTQTVSAPEISIQRSPILKPQKKSSEPKSSESSSSKVRDVARNASPSKSVSAPAPASGIESLPSQTIKNLSSESISAGSNKISTEMTDGTLSTERPLAAERSLATEDALLPETQTEPHSSVSDPNETSVSTTKKPTGKTSSRPKAAKKQEIASQEPTRRSGRAKTGTK